MDLEEAAMVTTMLAVAKMLLNARVECEREIRSLWLPFLCFLLPLWAQLHLLRCWLSMFQPTLWSSKFS